MVLKCRSCLVKVESQDSVNIFTTTKAGQLISDFLISLAPIQILNNDGLPANLCRSCEEQVNVLVDFRTLLMTSDAELRKMKQTSVYLTENHTLIKEKFLEVYLHTEEDLEEKYDRNRTSDFCFDSPTWQENKQTKSRIKDNEHIETVDPLFDCPLPITKEDLLQNVVKEEFMNEDFLLEDETTETIADLTEEQMEETASCSSKMETGNSCIDDMDCEPEAAKENTLNSLPIKSRERYGLAYNQFMNWLKEKSVESSISERVLLLYFGELSGKVAPSTLWTVYSMLNSTLNTYENVNIAQYVKLRAFIKRKSHGYKPRKSKTFTAQEIQKFLSEAPDDKHLLQKVILIVAISGACRLHELVQLKVDAIEDLGSAVFIKIPDSKNQKQRAFTITGKLYQIYKKYAALRPDERRFFLNYQNEKCTRQPVGVNKIANMPKQIATYLCLKEPELYTGHCFRRSAARCNIFC